MCLSSGSSGNCYYIGDEAGGFLIDAGIPIRTITKTLKAEGIPLDGGAIHGVIVTHDHADHIRTVGVIGGVYHLPVYATRLVHDSIANSRFVQDPIGPSRREIKIYEPFTVAGFTIEPFPVPHDSAENVGYHITKGDFRFTLATDVATSLMISPTTSAVQTTWCSRRTTTPRCYAVGAILSSSRGVSPRHRGTSPMMRRPNFWLVSITRV